MALDSAMLGTGAATDVRPAGLLLGATDVSTGGDMVDDLAALAASVAPVAGTAITFVASPACYAKVKMRLPTFAWAVFPSGAMSANQIAVFASNALVFAVDPTPSIDAATGTAVHMSDTPTALVASGTADPIRSTWQSDAIALRLTMSASWGLRASGAVAVASGCGW